MRLVGYKDMLFSKNYSISISEPCPEKWENMHPAAGGRFCDSCANNVVDFTGMTEKEIIGYFRNKKGATCGKFESSQLEKKYVVKPQVRLPFHQRFFSYLISFFVSNVLINKAAAQTDTAAIVRPDTIAQIAGNDSALLQNNSLAITKTDTIACEDDSVSISLSAGFKLETEFPVISLSDTLIIDPTMIWGYTTWEPPQNPEPGFLAFLKVKFYDSLSVLKKTTGIVKEEQILTKPELPETPEKPSEKETAVISAILPDELKLKGQKKA